MRAAVAAAIGLVLATAAAAETTGLAYHYIRSNRDGSDAEAVHVFRRDATHVEVYKAVKKCTNAALVEAVITPDAQQTTALIGGRLLADAKHQRFAWIDFDVASNTLRARAETPGGPVELATTVRDLPWRLYDFDLADLTLALASRSDRRADFSFGLPLLLIGEAGPTLTYLGRADARFVRAEDYRGTPALRFDVGGPAFGANGGPLWLDAAAGHILGVEWGIPNHAEYRDFKLVLQSVDRAVAAGWEKLLRAHFEGCPPRPQ